MCDFIKGSLWIYLTKGLFITPEIIVYSSRKDHVRTITSNALDLLESRSEQVSIWSNCKITLIIEKKLSAISAWKRLELNNTFILSIYVTNT